MCEKYYDKTQPNIGQDNFELHYMDTDSLITSFTPVKC